ncbi:uncharacterized protein LOC116919331 [Daphnia magna]|uniref:uncharacterized protein LOC116919331 n=1 Tax=Daphnia magna TaxID=35525 RepID=UPI001E1BAB9B|nr:uncharacterized protein LOC116919331 [Daphnia magna]
MEGFLGVSCSAVPCDYEPFTAFLSLREMPKNHTAAAIFAEYESTIEDWEVNKKEIRCVTDNARNMIAALRVKLPTFVDETEKAQEEEELIGIEIVDLESLLNDNTEKCNETGYNVTAGYHARCLPHHVKLAIKDGLLVLEVRKIVGGIRRSVVDMKTLMDCVGFKIPMLNQTRWSSQYGMIKGSLEAMDKDPNIQSKLNSCAVHGSLTAIQIKSLRELVILLGPFKIAMDAFQKEPETIGLVIPFYLDLVNKCSLDPQSLKTRLNYVLNDSLYLIGSILDPRIKKSFIEAGGLDEKAVLRAVSDIILSRENEIESSANEKRHNSQDPNDYETSSAAKRSKFNRPILSSVLPKPRTESYPASEKVLEEF